MLSRTISMQATRSAREGRRTGVSVRLPLAPSSVVGAPDQWHTCRREPASRCLSGSAEWGRRLTNPTCRTTAAASSSDWRNRWRAPAAQRSKCLHLQGSLPEQKMLPKPRAQVRFLSGALPTVLRKPQAAPVAALLLLLEPLSPRVPLIRPARGTEPAALRTDSEGVAREL